MSKLLKQIARSAPKVNPAVNDEDIRITREARDRTLARLKTRDVAELRQIPHDSFAAAEEEIDRARGRLRLSGERIPPLDCKAGCAYCCHMHVEATVPEVLRIADHMRESWTPEEIAAFRSRAEARAAATADKSREEKVWMRLPCPALGEDGRCTIYEVRPMACRGFNSYNVKNCERNFHDPSPQNAIQGFFPQFTIWNDQSNGIDAANAEAGLEHGCVEFSPGMLIALDRPDGWQNWLAGERQFTPAIEAESLPHIRATVEGLRRTQPR